VRGANQIRLRLVRIVNPEQFEIGIAEEEAPARGALAGMHVRFAFRQTERDESFRAERTEGSADEKMIELDWTGSSICHWIIPSRAGRP